jgi:endonuclease YncB( thermonuclease family)
MPFTLIKGTFHVAGYSPDGDSVRFQPQNPDLLVALAGGPPRFNARGHAQLRIEGIDALETHYNPPSGGGSFHQPKAFAGAAMQALIAFLAIDNVVWSADGRTVVQADDGTPGYILCREVEKYGRPVAFVFAGDTTEADGSDVFLDPVRLADSYNFQALEQGLAYATFYTGLFADLRKVMGEAVLAARHQKKGLYAKDVTSSGFTVSSLGDLTDKAVILPKLFRRLSEYVSSTGTAVGFKAALEQAREPVLDLVDANFTHFDTFIEQAEGSKRIRLTRLPEQLVFGPMKDRPGNPFSTVLSVHAQEDFAHGLPAAAAESV